MEHNEIPTSTKGHKKKSTKSFWDIPTKSAKPESNHEETRQNQTEGHSTE